MTIHEFLSALNKGKATDDRMSVGFDGSEYADLLLAGSRVARLRIEGLNVKVVLMHGTASVRTLRHIEGVLRDTGIQVK